MKAAETVPGANAAGEAIAGRVRSASTFTDELWRRSQSRREAALHPDLSEDDGRLLPLVLSLARLAAQRDARALG
jgi:hypothetical protein